jgi:hypothetical protein
MNVSITGMTDPARPPAIVYFDMNVWVTLARGLKARDSAAEETVAALREAVESGSATIPLTTAHYLELWHRTDQTSREDIGRLMARLSGYQALAPIQRVLQLEIEAFVARFRGADLRVAPAQVLGHGASYAFDSPYGRFRFVESLASADGLVAEGPAVEAPAEFATAECSGPRWEWLQLVGLPDILATAGVERAPAHRLGNANLEVEARIRRLVAGDEAARARLRDILIADVIEEMREQINDVCAAARVSSYGLFFGRREYPTPPEAMRAFIDEVPTANALVTLREHKHRDLTHPWDQHDRTDMQTLATALPYVDVIVTERRWAHMIRVSGLADRHRTIALAIRDLGRLIAGLAPVESDDASA